MEGLEYVKIPNWVASTLFAVVVTNIVAAVAWMMRTSNKVTEISSEIEFIKRDLNEINETHKEIRKQLQKLFEEIHREK